MLVFTNRLVVTNQPHLFHWLLRTNHIYNRASDSLVELLQRDEQVDVKPIGTHFIAAFDSLYLVSLLSLLAIFSTACASPRIRRFSTWYTFLLAWIFEAVSKLLLVGQQTSPIPPQFGICVAQASLINAIPVLYVFIRAVYLSAHRLQSSPM